MMQLHDFVGHSQTYAGARFFGREIKIEDFVANLWGDAGALIADFYDHFAITVTACANFQRASFRHRLHAVEHYVEQRLLEQIRIHTRVQRVRRELTNYANAMALGVWR